ncbi:nuclease-related domain-containing protein (plasmid) [Deinococcus radiomollis]|uniref:nuclease-related domain-containing protein n=1 Tax=Deinococcus radiomollis TaxID=468916 RepID=UPI00389285A4
MLALGPFVMDSHPMWRLWLRLEDGEKVAQIDHLALYRNGAVIVESKSVMLFHTSIGTVQCRR